MLKWCKKVENNINQPTLLNINTNKFVKADVSNFVIEFSEEMLINNPFSIRLYEFKNGNQTGKKQIIEVKNVVWSNNGKKLTTNLETDFEVFTMEFNWWGLDKPLLSKNGILLKPQSYILVKK